MVASEDLRSTSEGLFFFLIVLKEVPPVTLQGTCTLVICEICWAVIKILLLKAWFRESIKPHLGLEKVVGVG